MLHKKAVETCDIIDYGAKADGKTDISVALNEAFADCKAGGVVVIPTGDFALSTWVQLNGGSAWALQLDGTIYRTGKEDGNMLFIEHTDDFELFSSNGEGAIQGYGYEFHKNGKNGARLLRLYDVTNFSVHDISLVDSPLFHLVLDTCDKGEVYNMLIRGGNNGGLDGIDVWSTNIWLHDIMVTNKDECVTVKSPSQNILVENIYCNWSGGCAMGSLGADTDISNITYRNIYTYNSNQEYMIKSNGGSGSVSNVLLENFIGHSNAYSLDIDQYWESMSTISGQGVQLDNIKVYNWTGTAADGSKRCPVKIMCADGAPCMIDIEDFRMWTEVGDSQTYSCRSAYTLEEPSFCLKSGIGEEAYSPTTITATSAPTGYEAATLPDDLTDSFGTTASIPIPTWPARFFPGVPPITALAVEA
ncbi:Putative glycoside hydrolase, family 28, pectin lyase/virulence factor [Septoria linicola]|uniref:Glycoside hydrolase, family 28, pectin lyase/virulence factor n=1 Tax=Septoria linicola TaxID=215465 RepID=A0A9Q9EHN5_9PEZI|nr:putative glycoside hydrolase, family 28, pectin lyase/virulence factor [Septoria linicola]USW51165.1 Putative glycoside hydrolase, family 28, pectin lyase/virulence factor [Septoria linicola]